MDKFTVAVGWIGILAFALAIPMAVAANLMTPVVQRWWATTSNSRRERRVGKLKQELEIFNSNVPLVSQLEGIAYGLRMFAYATGILLLWFFGLLCLITHIHNHLLGEVPTMPPSTRWTVQFLSRHAFELLLQIPVFSGVLFMFRALTAFKSVSNQYVQERSLRIQRELDVLCGRPPRTPYT